MSVKRMCYLLVVRANNNPNRTEFLKIDTQNLFGARSHLGTETEAAELSSRRVVRQGRLCRAPDRLPSKVPQPRRMAGATKNFASTYCFLAGGRARRTSDQGALGVTVSLHWSPAKSLSLSVDTTDARVGRPLTPMSVAGVNRRVHRRAYYGAAAAGAAGYGYYNYARQCEAWNAGVCVRWY